MNSPLKVFKDQVTFFICSFLQMKIRYDKCGTRIVGYIDDHFPSKVDNFSNIECNTIFCLCSSYMISKYGPL